MSEPPPPDSSPNQRLAWACLGEAALVALAGLLAWLFGLPTWELVNPAGGQARALLVGLLATGPMVLFLVWMVRSRWPPIAGLREQAEQMVGALLEGASPAMLLTIAVLAGVGEEALFRGALQPLFVRWIGPWPGVLAVGLLFGLAHPISKTYVVVASIGGLYLGALAQLTGEALSAIVAHAAYDIVALYWLRSLSASRSGAA